MNPKVKIIILNWNQPQLTIDCIESVEKIKYDNYDILIIDNGSDDDSINIIEKEYSDIEILPLDKNYKFAGAYNRAIEHVENKDVEYLLLLNNDTIVSSDLIANFVENIKDNPNCIFGAKIYYLNNKKKIWYAGGKIKLNKGKIYHIGIGEIESGKYNANVETDYVTGCCMFAKKNIFTSLNGFDSSFNMYGEDVDFCIRANALGFKSIFIYNCLVWHHVSASISSTNKILTQISSMWKLTQKHNNGLSKYSAFLNYLINSMRKLF
tara:strand:- start:517 stop:1314 length:798 start_codon:yes stop_codon:yes gene_type:complete